MVRLKDFEKVRECIDPHITPPSGHVDGLCQQCMNTPFRVIVIEGADGESRSLALCGRHYSEFRMTNPEWKKALD